MKKFVIIISALLICVAFMPSCRKVSGSGPIVTETRGLSGFTEIKSEISADIFITPENKYEVVIEGQQNIIDVIETVLNNGVLTIRVRNNTIIKPDEKIKVHISSPDIRSLSISGSGNMHVIEPLSTSDLRLKISGSGNIHIQSLSAYSVDANISGSGAINIQGGTVARENLDIGGSGSINLLGLESANSSVKIAGSGDAHVFVKESLKVRISGSGSVYYKGEPAIDVQITGSGKLKKV